jgi:hypothetical protein
MQSEVEVVADAMIEKFKEVIADHAGMSFEETGVTIPNKTIWLDYAKAAIEALDNERRLNR